MDITDFKTTFDGILQTYVHEKISQSQHLLGNDKLNKIISYIQTFIFSGGKRIRPFCLWAVYMWLGGVQEKDIFQFGIVFELLHTMALIHDDIIDEAKKRHNALTMHSFVETLLKEGEHRHHIAEGQAILVGDLILSWVYELWYKINGFTEDHLNQARINIHSMIEEVILGQMIDVNMMSSWPATLDMIDKKNMYKTASYTFIRPMLTWAILAGASTETQALVRELGKNLGLAFQLRDDLLDLVGKDKTKSVFNDIQEGQQTYFTNYIFTNGTPEQKEFLSSCLGTPLTPEQIVQLQAMFESSGAIAAGKKLISELNHKARAIFEEIPLVKGEAKAWFERLIAKMEHI